MSEKDSCFDLKTLFVFVLLLITIPYWLIKTIFNTQLDFGTRLSYAVLSLPSAFMLFFIIVVFGTAAFFFIPVFLCSDAWPVGVFAILCVVCVLYQLIKVIHDNNKNGKK